MFFGRDMARLSEYRKVSYDFIETRRRRHFLEFDFDKIGSQHAEGDDQSS